MTVGFPFALPESIFNYPMSFKYKGITLTIREWSFSGKPSIDWASIDWPNVDWKGLLALPDFRMQPNWGTPSWNMPAIAWHGVSLPVISWGIDGLPSAIDWPSVDWSALNADFSVPDGWTLPKGWNTPKFDLSMMPAGRFEFGAHLSFGGRGGFDANVFGAFDPSIGFGSVSFTSLKSWTPLPSFAGFSTLPPFTGLITFGGLNKTYLKAEACAYFPSPVEPIPNAVRFGGAGGNPGPSICVGFRKEKREGGFDFKLNMSGSVRIGGNSGFDATVNGALDTATDSAFVTIWHAGGWSPLPGLSSYFTSPAFFGSLSLNRPDPANLDQLLYLNCDADLVFVSPIQLIPGFLKMSGPLPDGLEQGPRVQVKLVQGKKGDAFKYDIMFKLNSA